MFIFLFRCVILFLLIGIAFFPIIDIYNKILIDMSHFFISESVSLRNFGSDIEISTSSPTSLSPMYLDSLTLYSGMIIALSVVLAAVGITLINRMISLVVIFSLCLFFQVVGISYVASSLNLGQEPNLFSVGWTLLPAFIVSIWAYIFWISKLKKRYDS